MRTSLTELKDALDLESYFQDEGISYKRERGHSGPQLCVRECPVCGDRNSKVYLNAETGLGNCFRCDVKFNKFTFIMAHLGLDRESKKDWAQIFQDVQRFVKGQGWRPKKTFTAAVESEKATLPISFPLPTPEGNNLIYLERRGIDGATAKYFHLRYSEHGCWLFKREDGTRGIQNFGSRVIIPIYDLEGEFVTFQGRDATGESDKKYLFPAGLPATGRLLYNGQNAMRAKRACMGEGVFDVIATKLAFDEEADLRGVAPIGSFGKHLSAGTDNGDDQLERLRRLRASGLEELTIAWDGEEKALEAALEAAKKITPIGLRVRIALLPAGKDPNEISGARMCQAFREARLYTPRLHVELKIKNPYRKLCA